jgi:predicted DNA-binding antitoxin AbrB/MazE fold protein
MNPLIVEAVYENGVLKPAKPLPLKEQEQVQVTIRRAAGAADRTYGMIGWRGDADTFEHLFQESEADRVETSA